jgi:hypothetical protein
MTTAVRQPDFTSAEVPRGTVAMPPTGFVGYERFAQEFETWPFDFGTEPTTCPASLRTYVCLGSGKTELFMSGLLMRETGGGIGRMADTETTFVIAATMARAAWGQAVAATEPIIQVLAAVKVPAKLPSWPHVAWSRDIANEPAYHVDVLPAKRLGMLAAGKTHLLAAALGLVEADTVITTPTQIVAPEHAADESKSPAFAAFKDLCRWLVMTDAEISDLVGVGRTTPYSWIRDDHEPRAATVRRLYQIHALVSAVAKRLGDEETRKWFSAGSPTPTELLAQGDVDTFGRVAHDLLFGRGDKRREALDAWRPEDDVAPGPGAQRRAALRPARRGARRGRLTGD